MQFDTHRLLNHQWTKKGKIESALNVGVLSYQVLTKVTTTLIRVKFLAFKHSRISEIMYRRVH